MTGMYIIPKIYNNYYIINYILSIPRLLKIQDASDKMYRKKVKKMKKSLVMMY